MPLAHSYILLPRSGDANVALAADREALRSYHDANLAGEGVEFGEVFFDPFPACSKPFTNRGGWLRTFVELEKGDHLLVLRFTDLIGARLRDMGLLMEQLEYRGVVLHLADMGLRSDGEQGKEFLRVLLGLGEFDRATRADRAKDGWTLRRAGGKAVNGSAPQGYKMAGRKGRRRIVPDASEQAVMEAIAEWREQGRSVEEIRAHLAKQGCLTRAGREWSANKVRRAVSAELERRGKAASKAATPA
jgi:DNA invertase Pin-like site-specific DNA recombinase